MILPGNYIKDILLRPPGSRVKAHGWVKTRRGGKQFKFIQLNDGSSPVDLQVVIDMSAVPEAESLIPRITTGASICVEGVIKESEGSGQTVDLVAHRLILHGDADPEHYPIPKGKTRIPLDTLRDIPLRARTMTLSAVFRVRNRLAMSVHQFFQARGFMYVHTPLITVSDAEGAGSMFHVAAPDPVPFRAEHLTNPVRLAVKLRDADDPLSQYLRGRLPEGTLQLLADYTGSSDLNKSLLKGIIEGLVEGLNRALEDPSLSGGGRFAQEGLSKRTNCLIELRPHGEGLLRLNRLLLEQAYPNELAKNQKAVELPTYDSEDFFKRKTFLSVSGQLEAEVCAHAYPNVYTFGPTFRAEHSDTPRHLAEFYMIEPEMAFCDLTGNQALAEAFLKSLATQVLTDCRSELEHLSDYNEEPELLANLESMVNSQFEHITYTDAIAVLQKSGRDWEYKPEWGKDLQSEHERYLTEEYLRRPVVVTDYPRQIKAFYMRDNSDGKTVAAMDVLVPRVGEIIGGSQREERYDVLLGKVRELDAPFTPQEMRERCPSEEIYRWYLDLRRFGSVPHSGFGMGFERMMMYLTGMKNIRDVIPFPRTWKKADF